MSLPVNYTVSKTATDRCGVLRSRELPKAVYRVDPNLIKTLSAVTTRIIDSFSRELQIFQLNGYGMIGVVKESSGRYFVVGKHKISSPLCPDISSEQLMIRLQRAFGTIWDIIYKQRTGELIVLPHLEAAGKRGFENGPIKEGNANPVGHLNRDQLREMYVAKGFKFCYHHVDETSDYEIYENKNHKHIIDYRNQYNEKPHIDVFRKRDTEFFRKYPPHPDYGKNQLKARFAIKPDDKTGGKNPPDKSQATKNFHETLQKTGLTKSYNSSHPGSPAPEKRGASGEIGGVASVGDYIEGLFDNPESLLESVHSFFIPQENVDEFPFSEEELHQLLNELARGIYLHDTVPFFSLHFNQNADLYPVIHPVYEKTLVGQVFSMLDYMMKGYLNGGVFKETFVYKWAENPEEIGASVENLQEMIDFETYCKNHLNGDDQEYKSLKNILGLFHKVLGSERLTKFKDLLGKLLKTADDNILQDFSKFTNSFRIIAYQERIQKSKDLFVLNSNFKVEYTIEPDPDYKLALERYRKINGDEPPHYQLLVKAFGEIAGKIHDHFVKLPICQKYFSMLGVINFFSLYFKTLKKHGKYPLLPSGQIQPLGCPTLFPSLPQYTTNNEEAKLNFKSLMKNLPEKFKDFLDNILTKQQLSPKETTTVRDWLTPLIKREILANASSALKRGLNANPDLFDRLCEKIENELDFVVFIQTIYRNYLNKFQSSWTGVVLKLNEFQVREIFWNELDFNEHIIKYPIPISILILPSETTLEERISGRKVVGGCGMMMVPLKVEEIPDENTLLDLVSTKLAFDLPTTWHKIDQDDLGRRKGFVFNLPFTEIPFDPSENKQVMEELLLSSTLIDTSILKRMKLLSILINENRRDEFIAQLVQQDPNSLKDQEGQHLLHFAACKDDIFFTKKLIEAGVKITLKDRNGYTCLHHAAANGCVEQLKFLLEKQPRLLNKKNRNHATALFVALQNRQSNAVKFLIERGAVLQDVLKDGYTIFHTAAFSDDIESMKLILRKLCALPLKNSSRDEYETKNPLDQTTQEGITPLMVAVGSSFDMVKLLVDSGANVRIRAKNGENALDMAITLGDIALCKYLIPNSELSPITTERSIRESSLELNRLLVRMKGYYSHLNNLGDTALLIALRYANVSFALELIDLNDSPVFLNCENKLEETAIQVAAQAGFYDVIEKLLSKRIEMNRVQLLELLLRSGYTGNYESIQAYLSRGVYSQDDLQKLLWVAASAGNHVGITKCLLPLNVNLHNFEGPRGWKIEHYLARSDGIYLLRRQADLKRDPMRPLREDGGRTLLYIAAQNGSLRAFDYLLKLAISLKVSFDKQYLDQHLFWAVVESGNLSIVNLCIDLLKNVDLLNIPLNNEHTRAVHLAARMGLTHIVEFLWQKGADLSLRDLNGHSTLFYAIESQNSECIEFILKHQLNLQISAEEIYLAASLKKPKVFERLILSGAIVDQRSLVNQITPISLAIQENDLVAFKRLLEAGASFGLKTREGFTALHLAARTGNRNLLEIVFSRSPQELLHERVNGYNALHLAVIKGQGECIEFLLNNGFSIQDKTTDGKDVFEIGRGVEVFAALGKNPDLQVYKQLQKIIYEAIINRSLDVINVALDHLNEDQLYLINSYILLNMRGAIFRGTLLHLLLEHGKGLLEMKKLIHRIASLNGFDPTLKNSDGLSYAHLMILREIDPTQFENIPLEGVDNHGKTVLHFAASIDRVGILKALIDKVGLPMINAADKTGRTPIYYAILNTIQSNLELLCASGADVNTVDLSGFSPLALASGRGNLIQVKFLVKYGASLNSTNNIKEINPLEVALKGELEELSLFLLFSGFNLKKTVGKKVHLAHLAAVAGRLSIIRFFAARGMSISEHDKKGLEPVHYAAMTGNIKILEELHSYGIDLGSKSLGSTKKSQRSETLTPLDVAAMCSDIETVKWLNERGAAIEGKQQQKIDVLLRALDNDPINAEILIDEFKNYTLSENIETLLPAVIKAIRKDYLGPTKSLLNLGISIDYNFEFGNRLLHLACMHGAFHVTQYLLDQGADAMVLNDDGQSPIELAAQNASADQFYLMLRNVNLPIDTRNKRGETLLHIAAANRKLSHLVLLLEQRARLDPQDVAGKTPLFIAAEKGYGDIVELLILCGANPMLGTTFNSSFPHQVCNDDIRTRIEFFQRIQANLIPGTTFLHIAARYGSGLSVKLNCVRFDVDQQNEMGTTALHEAVRSGKNENVRGLILEGAEINIQDKKGNTPLAVACLEIKNKAIIQLLIDSNDDPVQLENDKNTILAKANEDAKLFEFLETILRKR